MDACPCDVALSIRVVGAARRSEREHVLMAWSMLACTRQRRPADATKFGCSPRVDPCQVPARASRRFQHQRGCGWAAPAHCKTYEHQVIIIMATVPAIPERGETRQGTVLPSPEVDRSGTSVGTFGSDDGSGISPSTETDLDLIPIGRRSAVVKREAPLPQYCSPSQGSSERTLWSASASVGLVVERERER